MDVALVIRQRLVDWGWSRRIWRLRPKLLSPTFPRCWRRKKMPPRSDRTDIYAKMERLLKLPSGTLSTLAAPPAQGGVEGTLGDRPRPCYAKSAS